MILLSCNNEGEVREEVQESTPTIKQTTFGQMPDGRSITQYTLANANDLAVKIINYGGIITSIAAPDKEGNMEDIVLGFESLAPYLDEHPYFGAMIGRYGNRIAKGKFELEGETYNLVTNNMGNHLHGGEKGFDKVVWEAEVVEDTIPVLRLSYLSPHMEEGYPGNLEVTIDCSLNNADELKLTYRATTDRPTIVNLTNHSYFNLAGGGRAPILDHQLMLNADRFLPVDSTLIPTGELRTVEGTPFDFREPTRIGLRIEADNRQLQYGGGYDHCWVINGEPGRLRLAARVHEPESGRVLELETTEPGLQFYSGNFLDGSIVGRDSVTYDYRHGLCLEPEHFPDSPNRPDFPSVVLQPGEKYETVTVYRFLVEE